jgi:nucleoside-diphosphate-sugar epimerase
MRIFLAGATGAIGRRLVPLLVGAGHEVTGTTRSVEKAAGLRAARVKPVVLDVFDVDAVQAAIFDSRPEVLIHQLTDLPQQFDPANIAEALARNARIRIEGTRNLIGAARAAGVRRAIAQSIAFAYAVGPEPHQESDPLAPADGPMRGTMDGVTVLEGLMTTTPGIEGIVLRYGHLYGPGTWAPAPSGRTHVHVDAAAHAAFLAVIRGVSGVYNIADDDGSVSIAMARRELGWNPEFRLPAALQ